MGGDHEVVEADESYIGGKARNKAFGPPPKKMAVLTLVEREGRARSRHVADVTAKTLRPAIVRNADRKSWLMTDEALVYEKIGNEFKGHGTVNHSADEYSRLGGFITTNSVESFFALLKRGVYGNYFHVSEAHLHRYLAEADFRYNHREKLGYDDTERAAELLRGTKGKRLSIGDLTKPRTLKQKARAFLRWRESRSFRVGFLCRAPGGGAAAGVSSAAGARAHRAAGRRRFPVRSCRGG